MEPSLDMLRYARFDAASPTEELSPLAQRAANEAWTQRSQSFGRMALLDGAGEATGMDVDPSGPTARSAHDDATTQPVGFGIQGTPGALKSSAARLTRQAAIASGCASDTSAWPTAVSVTSYRRCARPQRP